MSGHKVLVTGSRGLLGSYIIPFLSSRYRVVGMDSRVDVLDSKLVLDRLNIEKPDIIIHAAAFTDVDGCEKNIDKAYGVNTMGTQNMVNYCVNKNVKLIYISSTGVYGEGSNESYNEFDIVCPTTIHHKSKYEAEKVVCNHLTNYLILRVGWLYGGYNQNNNFVYNRFIESSGNDYIYSDGSQVGNPTSVSDVSAQLLLLIEKEQCGIFNCVNSAYNVSRFDYVKKIIEIFEVNCDVRKGGEAMFKRLAPVSKNESAINYKLNLLNLNIMSDWETALYKYMQVLKNNLN